MTLHETHVCRDCAAEITLPYANPPGAHGLPDDSGPLRDAYQAGFRAGYAKAEDVSGRPTATLLVPVSYIVRAVEELASWVDEFLADATPGPWYPEPLVTDEGLGRPERCIWLTNAQGDQLCIDEGTAARLVEALRLLNNTAAVSGVTR